MAWKGGTNKTGYAAVHWHLRAMLGPASRHRCVQCAKPAQEWAYDHRDPHEVTAPRRGRIVRYSLNPVHYRPMCRPCHRRQDGNGRRPAPVAAKGYSPQQWQHRKLRASWKPYVEAGQVDCARCGERIGLGEKWHLDHRDEDRSRYNGPAHASCNTAAGGRRSARPLADPPPQPRTRW